MPYIIDANNLAGRLDLLKEENFDEILTNFIRIYNKERQRKITLVFDGSDVMGDRLADGKLIIVYVPRDSYYKNADDKIIELIKQAKDSPIQEETVVITDDVGLKKTAEYLKVKTRNASDFAKELSAALEQSKVVDDKNNLGEDEMEDITDELSRLWK